jgi:hypothetical protein
LDKLTVRKPLPRDLAEAGKDLVTLRGAPPLILSAASLVLLTGNILLAVLTVGLTSFVHAFWTRLLSETPVER